MWDLWWTKWHWDRFCSQYFAFPLSVSFHQCSILIFIHTLLLLARQVGKAWEPCSWNSWPLKTGPIRCPETSVKDYDSTLRNTPEERRYLAKSTSFYRNRKELDRKELSLFKARLLTKRAPKGGCRAAAPQIPKNLDLKNPRFCSYYDIKSSTWFNLRPNSATEIGW
jgi:hypothetical protein